MSKRSKAIRKLVKFAKTPTARKLGAAALVVLAGTIRR